MRINPREKRKCLKKIRHDSKEDALVAVVRLKSGKPLRTYRCPVCKGWHLTSKVRSGQKDEVAKEMVVQ